MATQTPHSTISNLVSGKIFHKESGSGIPNLLVEIFDLDHWADSEGGANAETPHGTIAAVAPIAAPALSDLYKVGDRVGSVITDAGGNFRLEISPQDFSSTRAPEGRRGDRAAGTGSKTRLGRLPVDSSNMGTTWEHKRQNTRQEGGHGPTRRQSESIR